MLEYDEPKRQFIIFETFMKEGANKSTSKSIYIIHLNNQANFKYGRSNEVEFHIEEISVSRAHGELIILNDKVMIKDYKSKFGTQILNKSTFSLNKTDITQNIFQIGRTWLMISYQSQSKSSWLFGCLWTK